jgi:hypothetical protein
MYPCLIQNFKNEEIINLVVEDILQKIKNMKDNKVDNIYDKFFIIAKTIRYNTALITKIENKLVDKKIPCFHTLNDDEDINESLIKNKIVFTTFHQTKGLERDYVYIIGFKPNINGVIENSLYVATTRLKKQLILVRNCMDTVYDQVLKNIITFEEITQKKIVNKKQNKKLYFPKKEISISVVELIKNMDSLFEYEIYEKYIKKSIKIITPYNNSKDKLKDIIKFTFRTEDKEKHVLYENISNLNGIIIPSYLRYKLFNTLPKNFQDDKTCDVPLYKFYKFYLEEESINNGFISRKKNIKTEKHFNGKKFINKINYIIDNIKYEISFTNNDNLYIFEKNIKDNQINLYGRIDLIDDNKNIIYEFKCKNNKITHKDIIQLYIYMIINELYYNKKEPYNYILYNPVTLEKISIEYNDEIIKKVHDEILNYINNL